MISQLHQYLYKNLESYKKCLFPIGQGPGKELKDKEEIKQNPALISGQVIMVSQFYRRSDNPEGTESEFFIQYMLGPLDKTQLKLYDWDDKRLVLREGVA